MASKLLSLTNCVSDLQGSVYNAEDVDAMVTATVMEQEKQRQQEEALFTDFKPGETNKKKKVLMA